LKHCASEFEEAFKRGDIPAILDVLGEAQAVIAGKKWDERQKFIASLTLETDRLVIEPQPDASNVAHSNVSGEH